MPRVHRKKGPCLPLFAPTSAPEKDVIIHTDGACSGNPGPGGWAAIIESQEGFRELGGREEETTNNRMEMKAAVEALKAVPAAAAVHVVTDSRYLVDGICRWVHAWKRRGWRKADGEEVLNREIWEELDALTRSRGGRITWEHVRGHSGAALNERCDAIATTFARGGVPELRTGPGPWSPPGTVGNAPAGPLPGLPPFPTYLSFVNGTVAAHATWADCEARVRGARGARHRKVRSAAEYREALESWGAADV